MSKRVKLTERLRRRNKSEAFRPPSWKTGQQASGPSTASKPSPSSCHERERAQDPSSRPSSLCLLPTEVLAQILKNATLEDFCAFRLVCRHTSSLVHDGDIVREWMNGHIDDCQLALQPPPSPPSSMYLLEQRRRHVRISDTATVLAEYIEHEILRHTLGRASAYDDRRQGMFDVVKTQLKVKMIPLLLIISCYLETLAEELLSKPERQSGGAESPPNAGKAVLDSIASEHLLQAHKCWMFLAWLSKQILSRPSYAGTMERTMRGWHTGPLGSYDFRLFLVFGNLSAFKELVQLPSYKHRRRAVEAWMRGLDPQQNVVWHQKWQGMAAKHGEHPTGERASAVLKLRLEAGEIWVDDAMAALRGHGMLEDDDDMDLGTAWQTMDFLCDIAGYDVLHLPPPPVEPQVEES